MSNYLDELNDIQRQAVTTLEGPVMVIAGPGSGKTRVLSYRIAHLIQSGVAPWQILTLTFTNKAAREMKERISTLIGSHAMRVWAGTFHSIFARILRSEADKIGYPKDFSIYDSTDSKNLIKQIVKDLNLDKNNYNPNAILSRISQSKSNLVTPKVYAQTEAYTDYDKMSKRPMLHVIYQRYVNRCQKAGAMDFDDLLMLMYRLLAENKDGVRAKYQQAFRYLLVDEFQDTNFLQYEILKLLVNYEESKNNFCIVGDDAQSIYSFRGATIKNILQFQKDYPTVQVFKLEQNYRSTHHIVEAANEVITKNKRQIPKKIWTESGDGERIRIIRALNDTEEARRVADSIVEMKNRSHFSNIDIAILYRTNAQSRMFEEFLRRYNLPYRVFGGLSFYQRKEVKDVLAYLRLTVNPNDDEALKRVINYPKRGIGATTISKIVALANDNDVSLWEAIPYFNATKRTQGLLDNFVEKIKQFTIKSKKDTPYRTAEFIVKQSGVLSDLRKDNTIEGLSRIENIESLLSGVQLFEENDELMAGEEIVEKNLAGYLQNIALITDQDEDKEEKDYVSLMSVHAAKGLEYKSIFVVGMEENLFPSYMSVSDPDQLEEERRLFYVAITRAEQILTLTYATSRYQYGQMRFNDPSRFLEEIGVQHFDKPLEIRSKGISSFSEPKVLGKLGTLKPKKEYIALVDPASFKPSAPHLIKQGMYILHKKFGKGHVESIEGSDHNKVATIHFAQIDNPSRKIMLKFAKLQILDEE